MRKVSKNIQKLAKRQQKMCRVVEKIRSERQFDCNECEYIHKANFRVNQISLFCFVSIVQ